MEQTQLLEWDGEGDSTDGSDAAARETPKAVGRLHLLSSKYGPEKDFWIYPGENTIGRLESCHVCLPANSVSKTHAVIEVPSSHGPHLLYDQGSLNRTRRQRMNLVPQVRYSLQDGDTLLFGDVGCQYFILVPDTDYDSHDDSMAVPPTQGRVEASALAIEETPAPGRRIGFGQVLVQDSDKEEEGEEVMNGTGSYLHHTSKDESDCSNKNGSGEGQASLASFGVSSPSATVVPESDDETGDPSVDGPLCPALRLSFESQEAERSPAENGGSPSSNREDRGESTAAEHGLVEGFRLDSDTDVEDENQMGGISEAPASLDPEKRDRGPEVDPDTDLNESSVVAPVVRCPQTSMELGSDTDAEETVESPAVFRLKLPSTSMEKEEDDTDVEAEVENPSVVCPGKHEPVPPKEGDCKQLEDNVDNVQLGGKKDEDTDVEEDLDNPESSVNALPPTAHEDVDTDVEDSSVKGKTLSRTKNRVVGGHSDSEDVDTDVEDSSAKGKTLSRTKNRVVGGHSDSEDVDTDVEDSSAKGKTLSRTKNRVVGGHSNGDDTKEEAIKPQLENSEDTSPQRTCSSSGKESSTDMKDVPLKRIIPAGHSVGERHGDVVGLTKNPNVELEMSYAVGDQSPRDFDKKEISSNAMQHNLPMLLLGSDTDGEEEAGNPDVESMKSQHISGAEPSKGSRVSRLGDPDIGSLEKPSPGQDKDSDTDAEVTSMGRDKSTAQDSDTDAEDVAPSLLRKPLEEKSAQIIIPGRSQAGGEHSSTVGIGVSFKSREDNEDKDAEREESYSADESNTDDELDVSLQATQCYLPTATIPSGPEKAGGIPATAPVDDRVEENSELVRKTKNSKKVLVPAQEDPASATTPARELRRSLRSSTTSASPTPVPERRSLRCHGSGAVVASSTPAAPESRRRGLRQLSNASQQMREVKERPEQPGEEGPRKKARNGDLNAAPVPQGRTRGTQRASRAASKVTEVAKAISGSSPGAREPTKRVRRAPAPNPRLEGQTEHPRTRASKHSSSSSSTSVSTPSPKDSGKGAKLGQELVFTPSSGRRLRRHSPESKATSQKASSGSRTRRTTGSGSPAPKVLFTGVIDEEGERIVAELGGTLAESVFDCTHLVTDRVRRTVKFLCALARGIPIVTLDWLEKSRRNAFFLAPNNFLVRDPEQEENLRFSLSNSLQKAQQKGALFQGYEIHVTPNVKPEPEHMKDIVKCSGGTLLPRMPRAFKEKRIVVSCPEDLSRCKPAQEARVPITNAEFILTGILQQTVDLEAHRLHGSVGLSPASSPLVPSTRTSKRRAATQTAPAPPSTAKRRR
ncbi:mediator of DNA damage checkpoint protein 1 isoform X3 [Pantherophis guttatus]|uniref:Mediator of DNA damage checkpoint protein 1 n=1 Tax=Pantherophis guttatus TaxID=94885 RepID=A0A6P9BZX4_PANGU|nr:mediator of DNA damage checkpoint protein 1 isoform X3 [Pantherophis guttatus]